MISSLSRVGRVPVFSTAAKCACMVAKISGRCAITRNMLGTFPLCEKTLSNSDEISGATSLRSSREIRDIGPPETGSNTPVLMLLQTGARPVYDVLTPETLSATLVLDNSIGQHSSVAQWQSIRLLTEGL